jgi:hypothetical protein
MSMPRSMHLPCSLLADGTSQASWRSATPRLNSALVDTKPVLLSLAALSPMGCGARKDVLQVLRVLRNVLTN